MKRLVFLGLLVVLFCGCETAPSDAKWEQHEFGPFCQGLILMGNDKEPSFSQHIANEVSGEEFYLSDSAYNSLKSGKFKCLVSPKREGDSYRKIWSMKKLSIGEQLP